MYTEVPKDLFKTQDCIIRNLNFFNNKFETKVP